MSYEYIDRTERITNDEGTELIVQLVADTTGIGDPRENDNIAVLLFFNHRRYELGDRSKLDSGEQDAFEHGGLPGLLKHIEREEGKLLAHTLVGMYDHSGITIYPIAKANQHHPFDSGGWDSGCLGLAYVTEKRADELGAPHDDAEKQMLAEIEEYDDWIRGNVWGIIATKPCPNPEQHINPRHVNTRDDSGVEPDDELIAACPHSEHQDSVWGFIGDPKDVWPDALDSIGLSMPLVPA